jgi:DNA-binding CsgD family transcriptional regulator
MADLSLLSAATSRAGQGGGGDGSLALLVVDDDCRCVDAGLGACRLLGTSREQVIGRHLEELLAPEARDRFRHVWEAFRDGGGHAGPFLLDAATPIEANITVTARVLPARHLLVLTPTGAGQPLGPDGNGAIGAPQTSTRPSRRERDPTSRERQVLRLLASGATDVQIAAWLSLSPATVQTHVRNAKAKLGARTRAQAVALALQRGMIQPRG